MQICYCLCRFSLSWFVQLNSWMDSPSTEIETSPNASDELNSKRKRCAERFDWSSCKIRIRVAELNPFLLCSLCNGYLIDACTISECGHSYCRSCLFANISTQLGIQHPAPSSTALLESPTPSTATSSPNTEKLQSQDLHRVSPVAGAALRCPLCDSPLQRAHPERSVRADRALQLLVYKLVPMLHANETNRRRTFGIGNFRLSHFSILNWFLNWISLEFNGLSLN